MAVPLAFEVAAVAPPSTVKSRAAGVSWNPRGVLGAEQGAKNSGKERGWNGWRLDNERMSRSEGNVRQRA